MAERRFPPPWSVEDNGACFIVKDSSGQKMAYVYYEEEPGRRSVAKVLTKDETRRIAANVAKLPELLQSSPCAFVAECVGYPRISHLPELFRPNFP